MLEHVLSALHVFSKVALTVALISVSHLVARKLLEVHSLIKTHALKSSASNHKFRRALEHSRMKLSTVRQRGVVETVATRP